MSCGEPREVDCAEVLQQVYVYLDHELDSTHVEQVRHHLDDCAPCLRQYGLEQVVRSLLARSCRCEDAPAELRAKVMTRIRSVQVDIVREQ